MSDSKRKLRVLIADASPPMSRLLGHIIGSDPQLRVIAEAENGNEAVELAIRTSPDVIVMDVMMPLMTGLEATRRIMETRPTPIVLVSETYDAMDLHESFQALEAGALTLVAKPSGPQSGTFAAEATGLAITVKLMADIKVVRRRRARGASEPDPEPAGPSMAMEPRSRAPAIVAIAASTGGPAALARIMSALPVSTPVPIVVVQHITAGFHQGLAEWLDSISPLSVRLARAYEPLRAGEVLLAPGDVHLGVTGGDRVELSPAPPIGGHRPSATHLFRSVAGAYGAGAVGAILTGMGDDGLDGLRAVKQAGGLVLAQDEATSVVYGMPRRVASTGIADQVLPIGEIAGALISAWEAGRR